MKRQPYSAYKPANTEWLDSIPCDWDIKRLRFSLMMNPSKSEIASFQSDSQISFVPMEAVGEYGGLRLDLTNSLEEISNGYTYFRDGDILVAKITPCFENGKGAIAEKLENGIGFGTTELHVLRPSPCLDRRYLFYITISHAFRKVGASYIYGAGGQKRVPEDFIKDVRHPLPSVDEQCSIADFLDRETARIDALIAKKQRQIELLQEKRAALISHAVTKGLNPDAKMKESGEMGWGAIPAHWKMKRLMHLTPDDRQIMYGIVLPGPDYDGGVPIVKGGNCEPGRLALDLMSRTDPEIEAKYARSRLKPLDIVYAIRGSIGAATIVPNELLGANLTQDAARISPRTTICNAWLLYTVQSRPFFSILDAKATGATIRGINIFDLSVVQDRFSKAG